MLAALGALDAEFLARNECYFGGGTRIVLSLGEYRESADVDFLCASRAGYRALRSTVSETSLGRIAKPRLKL
ncbi:MAG: nucleotidyl transferase AbiEii/AbiGii toxin family protein, partial [Burkholderiales bacterium]